MAQNLSIVQSEKWKTGSFYIFLLSPNSTKCTAALVLFLLAQENFCSVIYSLSCFDKLYHHRKPQALFPVMSINLLKGKKKSMMVCLTQLPLTSFPPPPPPASTPPLCLLCLALCSSAQEMLWLLKVRLLYWYTMSKQVLPFVWQERCSPQTSMLYTYPQIKQRTRCVLGSVPDPHSRMAES